MHHRITSRTPREQRLGVELPSPRSRHYAQRKCCDVPKQLSRTAETQGDMGRVYYKADCKGILLWTLQMEVQSSQTRHPPTTLLSYTCCITYVMTWALSRMGVELPYIPENRAACSQVSTCLIPPRDTRLETFGLGHSPSQC